MKVPPAGTPTKVNAASSSQIAVSKPLKETAGHKFEITFTAVDTLLQAPGLLN